MEIIHLVLRFLHLIGFAGVIGGLLAAVNLSPRRIKTVVIHGAWTQLITGIILVGLNEPEVDHAKVSVKLVLLLILVAVIMRNRNKDVSKNTYFLSLLLGLVTSAVAVFW